jgi:hypothetical protein
VPREALVVPINETDTSWLAVLLVLAALTSGCSKAQEPSEWYEIVSHSARWGDWVIIKVDNEKRLRVEITAACDFYKWGSRDRIEGGCDLPVGATLVPNRLGTRPGEFLDVWQSGDTLFIRRGSGDDREYQQFSVRSAKVVR